MRHAPVGCYLLNLAGYFSKYLCMFEYSEVCEELFERIPNSIAVAILRRQLKNKFCHRLCRATGKKQFLFFTD